MIGKTIGNCELVGELGSGGMAIVYRALQQPLGRSVAVKRLKAEMLSTPDLVQRFRREAHSVANLQHENIVTIYDFIEEKGGGLSMVLEYVEGIDLHALLARCEWLPGDLAAIIGHKLISALEYAHYRKVVHRDIKPANVMISFNGEVKLTDFGIAKDMLFDDLTRTGLAIGTPAYMSPEQVVGAKLDYKSDIFSFGILFYQMLTGHKPFEDDEQTTVLAKIRDEGYTPVRKVNPYVPRSLAKIVDRCLKKLPEERYQAAANVRQDLEQYLAVHVPMNYSGRLVAYLLHTGVVEEQTAELYIDPAVLDDPELRRLDLGGPPTPPLWHVPAVASAALILMFGWISVVHAGLIGPGTPTALPAIVDGNRGFLRVVVDPWAHVYVDGAFVDTTPFARQIELPPGEHEVVFKNEYLEEQSRSVNITRDENTWLRIKLGN